MSGGKSSSQTSSNQNSMTQPWAPAVPYLTQFLDSANAASQNMGPTGTQLDAFSELMNKAAGGNPFTSQIEGVANHALDFGSNAGAASDAYTNMIRNLGDYASGKFVNPNTNPVEQQTLQSISDQVANKVNSEFAAAGRPAGGNADAARAMGEGITQAELPYLNQLYTTEQGNQIGAANALGSTGLNAAQLEQLLNSGAISTQEGGIPVTGSAMAAENYAPNTILNLSQQLESLPFSDLAQYASLLLPTAGLGGQFTGNATSTTNGSNMGVNFGSGAGAGMAGSALGAMGKMFSDERVKHNIEHVGNTHDGQKIYSFQYKDDPTQTTHMGLIAQKVEKKHPEAVGSVGGIKTVNYDAALADSKRQGRAA